MTNATKPDALEILLRQQEKSCVLTLSDGAAILAQWKAERREKAAENQAWLEDLRREHFEVLKKARYHLERVIEQFDASEARDIAYAPDVYDFADAIRDALKALNGGSE